MNLTKGISIGPEEFAAEDKKSMIDQMKDSELHPKFSGQNQNSKQLESEATEKETNARIALPKSLIAQRSGISKVSTK